MSTEESLELTKGADSMAGILHIDTESVKCYLCNTSFNTGDKSYLLFNERLQNDGTFDCPLSQILSAALDIEVEESTAHSTLLCSQCNLIVLSFERFERKLFTVRTHILNAYKKTRQHFEMLANDANETADVKLEGHILKNAEFPQEAVYEEVLDFSNSNESDAFSLSANLIKSDQVSERAVEVSYAIKEEGDLIYEDQLECQGLDFESSLHGQDGIAFNETDYADEVSLESQQEAEIDDVEFNEMESLDIYTCELCEHNFENEQDLGKHFAEQHPEHTLDLQYECDVCSLAFETCPALLKHLSTHETHKKTQSEFGRPMKCDHCNKHFASAASFKQHMEMYEKHQLHGERGCPMKCDHCDKLFLSEKSFQQHKLTYTKQRPFVCELCQKSFATKHNLEAHSITHKNKRPYSCKTCDKSFARKAEIIDHERIHAGLRLFKCEHCEASFTQRSNLTSHKRLTHYNETLFQCDICQRSFKRRRLLEYHKNAVHYGKRPYKCDKCPSTFVYKEHFKKHLIIHTGEKPFACEVCGKRFNSRDNRNAHRFVHSDKKPYECVVCSAGFMRKPLLLTHMKQASHMSETIIVNQPQINGGVIQTTTTVVQSVEETSEQSQEMIIDHLDASLQSEEGTTDASNDVRTKDADDEAEMYEYMAKIDDSVDS